MTVTQGTVGESPFDDSAHQREQQEQVAKTFWAGFHKHLDECYQCREHPMALCSIGAVLLRSAALSGPHV